MAVLSVLTRCIADTGTPRLGQRGAAQCSRPARLAAGRGLRGSSPAPPSPTARRGPTPITRPPAASPPPLGLHPDPDPRRTSQSSPPPRPARGARARRSPPCSASCSNLAVSPSSTPRSSQPRARPWAYALAPERRKRELAPPPSGPAACRAPAVSAPFPPWPSRPCPVPRARRYPQPEPGPRRVPAAALWQRPGRMRVGSLPDFESHP